MKFKVLILGLVPVLALAACKKYNDAPATALGTLLSVTNAGTDTLNLYQNGTRLNNNSNLFPAGSTGYIGVKTQGLQISQNYQFKKVGNPLPFLSVPLKLDSNKYYSLFVTTETTDGAFVVQDLLTDAATQLSNQKGNYAMVRFVNASLNSGTLDMALGDTVKLTNQAYKTASGFVPVGAGLKSINVYSSGSSTPIISGHIPLQIGHIYTLFTKGLENGTGNTVFGVGIDINQ